MVAPLSGIVAGVRMPPLFADGMVLQRGRVVDIGGWADPEFLDLTYEESKTSDLTPRMEVDWIRYWINENYTTDGAGGVNPNGKFF